MIEDGLVTSLVVEFKKLSPTLIRSIEENESSKNFKKLELHSHSLKSSARLLGFMKMADLCLKIETAASAGQSRPECVSSLAQAQAEALLEIDRYLKMRAAS